MSSDGTATCPFIRRRFSGYGSLPYPFSARPTVEEEVSELSAISHSAYAFLIPETHIHFSIAAVTFDFMIHSFLMMLARVWGQMGMLDFTLAAIKLGQVYHKLHMILVITTCHIFDSDKLWHGRHQTCTVSWTPTGLLVLD